MNLGRTFVMTVAAAVLSSAASSETRSGLGTLHFPTSGSEEAQAHFLRGVKALHSFWYEEAEEAFKRAQEVDPDFPMAYWGEAMTYNHPLWSQQDIAAARKALGKLGKTPRERLAKAPTPRERAYLEAIEILYGSGDKLTRDKAYSEAMRALSEAYPDDDEAACFYALSLLGTVRSGEKGFRRQMKSATILAEVFNKNPNHPGVAHYTIHSFDDPDHAPLALPAAKLYAKIAPEAPHALHMPSHIFIQLGMWDEASASNDAAYEASVRWVEGKGLSHAKHDFHSLGWGQYADLQRGRHQQAWKDIEVVKKVAEQTGSSSVKRSYTFMFTRYLVEAGRWKDLALPEPRPDDYRYGSTASLLLAAGMGATASGDWAKAEEAASRLRALRKQEEERGRLYQAKSIAIMEKEVSALVHFGQENNKEAFRLMGEATAIEEAMDPPSGPPHPLKPSHELHGEILLEAGKPDEAREQFEIALLRMPRRTASLLGLARSAAKAGDTETASRAYRQLLEIWHEADVDLPALQEARAFAPTTEGSN
ncbi:MAG: hypothetical protein ACE5JI_07665 [Acidobacteriota bacterium]